MSTAGVANIVSSGPELQHSRKPELYGAITSTFALATIAVVLRIIARRLAGVKLWVDDWFCLVAYLLVCGQFGMLTYGVWRGLGIHIIALLLNSNINDIEIFFKILLAEEVIYNLSLLFIKLAILALYWRIFHPAKYMRIFLRVAAPAAIIWTLVLLIITLLQCDPLSRFWDTNSRLFSRLGTNESCRVSEFGLYLSGAIIHIVADVVFLLAPIPAIWRLPRPIAEKIAVLAMFLLGSFVCVISIIRLKKLLETDMITWDLTWSYVDLAMWTVLETHTALICACLPSLRPIVFLFSSSFTTVSTSFTSTRGSGKGRSRVMRTTSSDHDKSLLELSSIRSPGGASSVHKLSSPTTATSSRMGPLKHGSFSTDAGQYNTTRPLSFGSNDDEFSEDVGPRKMSFHSPSWRKTEEDIEADGEIRPLPRSHARRVNVAAERLRAVEAFDEVGDFAPYRAGVEEVRKKLRGLDAWDGGDGEDDGEDLDENEEVDDGDGDHDVEKDTRGEHGGYGGYGGEHAGGVGVAR